MWDWELLKNGSGRHCYDIQGQYKNEDFQYTHAVSYGSLENEFCLHNHAMYELVYCVQGDAVYMVEGVKYALEPGGLLIINPAVPHKLFICSDAPFERHIVYIHYAGNSTDMASLLAKCQPVLGEKRMGSAYYPPEDARNCAQAFVRMSEVSKSKDKNIRDLMNYFAQYMIAELAMMILRKKPEKYSLGTSRTMDTLLIYLSQNFTKDLSLQEIADVFHLSKDYCNRLFHDATGMTVMQYITYNRILLAKQLLANGTPAIEAAKSVGYSEYSSFYRAYKKVTGRPPSDDHEIPGKILEMPFSSPTDVEV